MINKIINKIKSIGLINTCHLIYGKFAVIFQNKINILNKKNNKIKNEWTKYWNSYNYIKRKYLKKIKNAPLTKGTCEFSNKVWWCWLQGENECPPLQKKCLESLRKNLKDREIIVITKDNLYEYIELPQYIIDKYKNGIISNTHFSDLVRLQLLINYGGTWIDSTAYCTAYDKELFDKPLFVYKNLNYIWYSNKNTIEPEPILADNWFITSEINSPILILVRDLLFDYWKNYNYLIDYFIFHYFFNLVVKYKYTEEFNDIPLRSHLVPHLLQYECYNKYNEKKINDILNQSTLHKLTHKLDLNTLRDDCYYKKLIEE